jgi:hypothetical protein
VTWLHSYLLTYCTLVRLAPEGLGLRGLVVSPNNECMDVYSNFLSAIGMPTVRASLFQVYIVVGVPCIDPETEHYELVPYYSNCCSTLDPYSRNPRKRVTNRMPLVSPSIKVSMVIAPREQSLSLVQQEQPDSKMRRTLVGLEVEDEMLKNRCDCQSHNHLLRENLNIIQPCGLPQPLFTYCYRFPSSSTFKSRSISRPILSWETSLLCSMSKRLAR